MIEVAEPARGVDPDVLTKDQVAELLQCDAATVEDKARNGELPAVKIGRSWVFPRSALLLRLNEMALVPKRTRGMTAAIERQARIDADTLRRRKVSPFTTRPG